MLLKSYIDILDIEKFYIAAQKRESKIAELALHEADIEMGGVHYEKRQLTFQWNSTLAVLVQCDRAIKVQIIFHKV